MISYTVEAGPLQQHSSRRRRRGLAESLLADAAGAHHIVLFYEGEDALLQRASRFLAAGLREGAPVLLYASRRHLEALAEHLRGVGLDVHGACVSGQLRLGEAEALLSTILHDGQPDPETFAATLRGELQAFLGNGFQQPPRIYAEMADILHRRGDARAALRMEEIGNELAKESTFSLLCSASIAAFGERAGFQHLCRLHTHVVPAESYQEADDPAAHLAQIASLQQRALAQPRPPGGAGESSVGEEKLEQAAAGRRAQATFLANMSHELRTPLNAIIGFSELIQDGEAGAVSPEQRRFLGFVLKSGRKLLGLVNDLLELSDLEAGRRKLELTTFDLTSCLRRAHELVRPQAEEKGISIVVAPACLPPLTADEVKVRRVVAILLGNAVKFTPRGGNVGVTARAGSGSEVEICVTDDGPGISAESRERIFQVFEQGDASIARSHLGVGLGLAQARGLVALHGGRIWVESAAGKGSTFRFTIPQSPSAEDALVTPAGR